MKPKNPKSVYTVPNSTKFKVLIQSKNDKKLITVGTFDDIENAIKARDEFVISNYHNVTKGYMPRGIVFQHGRYRAYLSFKNTNTFIGSYKNINEAINGRNSFIDSLK